MQKIRKCSHYTLLFYLLFVPAIAGMAKSLNYLTEHNLLDYEKLEKRASEVKGIFDGLTDEHDHSLQKADHSLHFPNDFFRTTDIKDKQWNAH